VECPHGLGAPHLSPHVQNMGGEGYVRTWTAESGGARKLGGWAAILVIALIAALGSGGPASAAPAAQYFPATGHWVQGDFLTFFNQHGGLAIFGYPRTEEFYSDGRLVQYFQRARMESWPENPPPYNVQLMLIGDAVMGPADPPIPANQIPSPGDPTRTYFPQTGHTISGAFKQFFDANGGLQIFGYPTSEEYRGPSGFPIQRFQRARMELHAELPAAYQVSLGLLGDQYIFAMGQVPLTYTEPVSASAPPPVAVSASAPGQLIYQTQLGGSLVESNLDGAGAHVVGQGLEPAWSPDGKQFSYAWWGANPGIYVANADGSQARLVYANSDCRSPVWSPDGSQIAFYRKVPGYVQINGTFYYQDFFQVMVVRPADGHYWIPPGQPKHSYSPSWSPDGKTLVFNGDGGLYLVSADQVAMPIPNTDYHMTTPTWSPDGKQIAFTDWNQDHWDIGVINPDGSGLHLLTSSSLLSGQQINNASATWSPDSARLLFLSDRTGRWNLFIMNRDGSGVVQAGTTVLAYTGSYERVVSWKK
jgi:hypothetical protein